MASKILALVAVAFAVFYLGQAEQALAETGRTLEGKTKFCPGVVKCSSMNDKEYEYHAYPGDCSRFCYCSHGKPVEFSCPEGLEWNTSKNWCDWPKFANCLKETVPEPEPEKPEPQEPVPEPEGPVPAPEEPIPAPEKPVPPPEEQVPEPEGPVPAPEEPVPVPEEQVQEPERPVPAPEEPIPAPEEPVPVPEEQVPEPERPVPAPENTVLEPEKLVPEPKG